MHFHLVSRFGALLIAAGLFIANFAGCSAGPKKGEVSGKVTFKGTAVKEGLVTFLNTTEGGAFEAEIAPGGMYAVSGGVVLGDYMVVITPLTEIRDTDPGKTPPTRVEKAAADIPKKYRMQGSSPFKASVQAGKNEIHFDMTP